MLFIMEKFNNTVFLKKNFIFVQQNRAFVHL
jgi:hypothetical protein